DLQGLDQAGSARFVFSALPRKVAEAWEPRWVAKGRLVFTNAGARALGACRPVIPEVNPEALPASAAPGIVFSPNCTAHGLALALAPLRRFGLQEVLVTTLQATSGAGRAGVPELAGGDNVLPWIPEEEARIESETAILLGGRFRISASCMRVPVRDGHTLSVAVRLRDRVEAGALVAAWRGFPGAGTPSAPERPLRYLEAPDRPQPRLDRDAAGGMQVSLGRLRRCAVLDWKFTALVHNLVRGAAGGLLLNAERMALQAEKPPAEAAR
ncbi:MAG: aspartate-semialdehyde dehydrogenase, partial [Planctomycetota bacterium]